MKNYQMTRKQYLNNLYSHMKERVTNPAKSIEGRKYLNLPICTREQFLTFGLNDKSFERLFKNYKRSKGERKKAPSVDRIRNTGGYTLNNIQFISQSANSNKDRKAKSISIKHVGTKHILRFHTTTEVARFLGHKREVKLSRAGFTNLYTGAYFKNMSRV